VIHAVKVAFSVLCCMKTVGEARIWLKEKLKPIFSAEELPEIQLLILQTITGLTQTQQHIFPENQLSEDQLSMLLLSVQKLETGMPVQYALGEADFFGLKFKVDPSVLIPRPETEELVAWVLEEKRSGARGKKIEKILDIGTGSGCIPIAVKKKLAGSCGCRFRYFCGSFAYRPKKCFVKSG